MNSTSKITIIIPCYNEINFLEIIIQRVLDTKIPDKQIIIVDDFSTDGSKELLKNKIEPLVNKVIYHEKNMGKGACIKSGIQFIEGDIVIIQDADLEYNPSDHEKLVNLMIDSNADVVYGSRFLDETKNSNLNLYLTNRIANFMLTALTNLLTGLKITDMETGLKCFKKKAIQSINLIENRFGFEPEVTIKLAKKKFKFEETDIAYYARTFKEGKKIRTKDGVVALFCIIKYFLIS
ncbi:glycosyltransferase family 2 protein [Candidatus Pelagibacter sp.]|jgi:glycosyltransferase involved in cell wall biosynthesis|nr:glycosyltransferase family 2 protein [Candidatus Pelagibacter sp.]